MNIEYINSLKLITAIILGYVQNYGKVTIMYLKDGGTVKVNFSLYKVLKDYCLIHYLNLKEVKSISKKITGTGGKVPIFIREDKILIAFKVYEKVPNDRYTGKLSQDRENEDYNRKIVNIRWERAVLPFFTSLISSLPAPFPEHRFFLMIHSQPLVTSGVITVFTHPFKYSFI